MNYLENRSYKGSSPIIRSNHPVLAIDSSKLALANYRLIIKKSRENPQNTNRNGLASSNGSPLYPSIVENNVSNDTCIYPSPLVVETDDIQELREQIENMRKFTQKSLDTQRKYFEDIIFGLEDEIIKERASFSKEIAAIKDEIANIREEKEDSCNIFSDDSSNSD